MTREDYEKVKRSIGISTYDFVNLFKKNNDMKEFIKKYAPTLGVIVENNEYVYNIINSGILTEEGLQELEKHLNKKSEFPKDMFVSENGSYWKKVEIVYHTEDNTFMDHTGYKWLFSKEIPTKKNK